MLFRDVAGYFERIQETASRLEMTNVVAEMLGAAGAEDVRPLVYLCQGQVSPEFKGLEIGLGEKLVEEALAKVSGFEKEEIERRYKKKGDLGLVAEDLVAKKKQQSLAAETLSLQKVFDVFLKMATVSGHGSQETKLKLLAQLLNSATPKEARYLTRIPLGALRLGIGDPTILDAFALLFADEFKRRNPEKLKELEASLKEKKKEKRAEELALRVKQALREKIEGVYNVHSDLGDVAELLKKKGLAGLREVKITPGIPIRPTLAERLPSSKEIVEKIGKCIVEKKYDGFRLQCHKDGDNVTIFSRRSENMTPMFPEVVEGLRSHLKAKKAIVEGEALAFNEEKQSFYPFQVTIQRKRKYGIEAAKQQFPLKLFLFDAVMVDGENLMEKPFKERRATLKKIVKEGGLVALTDAIETDKPDEIDKFFADSLNRGLEGIIAKDPNAKYIAGARKFAWIKLKKSYQGELQDSVDVVIVGYDKGRGKRAQFGLGALHTAVYDPESDSFKTVAKVGTGLSEEQLQEMEDRLSKDKLEQKPVRVDAESKPDVWVEPKYVIEVRADEITKSPVHTAGKEELGEGLALRFPRMVSFRDDRAPEQATTVDEIIRLFEQQKRAEAVA